MVGVRNSNREWIFAERPEGEPDMDSFELRERDIPDPKFGQLLVRVRYLSVDPYIGTSRTSLRELC